MKPSLQTFMSPGDTRTVPRRLYKADVNPDSDYRQWTTLKQSAVDRCTSDTQLQLCNVDADVTSEPQEEQTQTERDHTQEEDKEDQSLNFVEPIGETESLTSSEVSKNSIHSIKT